MRLQPGLGRKRIFAVFRAQETCLVAVNVVLPTHWKANSTPPDPLAGFQGPLRGGEERGQKRRKGEKRKGKVRK